MKKQSLLKSKKSYYDQLSHYTNILAAKSTIPSAKTPQKTFVLKPMSRHSVEQLMAQRRQPRNLLRDRLKSPHSQQPSRESITPSSTGVYSTLGRSTKDYPEYRHGLGNLNFVYRKDKEIRNQNQRI